MSNKKTCQICGGTLERRRQITINKITHCVPCNIRAFIDLDPRAREILKIEKVRPWGGTK